MSYRLHKELQLSQKIQRHCKPQCEALPAGLVDGLIIILPMLRKLLVLDAPYKDFVMWPEVSIIGNLQRHTP
jgi:hypothetical protein